MRIFKRGIELFSRLHDYFAPKNSFRPEPRTLLPSFLWGSFQFSDTTETFRLEEILISTSYIYIYVYIYTGRQRDCYVTQKTAVFVTAANGDWILGVTHAVFMITSCRGEMCAYLAFIDVTILKEPPITV